MCSSLVCIIKFTHVTVLKVFIIHATPLECRRFGLSAPSFLFTDGTARSQGHALTGQYARQFAMGH